jgi:hypothetical protein
MRKRNELPRHRWWLLGWGWPNSGAQWQTGLRKIAKKSRLWRGLRQAIWGFSLLSRMLRVGRIAFARIVGTDRYGDLFALICVDYGQSSISIKGTPVRNSTVSHGIKSGAASAGSN